MKLNKDSILCIIGLICLVMSIVFNWGLRERMIELDNWKQTYESGYCPTCGQPLQGE